MTTFEYVPTLFEVGVPDSRPVTVLNVAHDGRFWIVNAIELPSGSDALEPLFRSGGIEDMSVGFIVWHRSSVFGVFAQTKGGINFMGFGVEAKF